MTLYLSAVIKNLIWQAGERHYPLEGAGVMLGVERDGDRYVLDALEVENMFDPAEQHHRYRIDPMAMLAAEEQAESMGFLLLGIFHSHPDHPAIASDYDREMAAPWYSYLITSVQNGKAIESRVWRFDDSSNQMVQEELQILSEGDELSR